MPHGTVSLSFHPEPFDSGQHSSASASPQRHLVGKSHRRKGYGLNGGVLDLHGKSHTAVFLPVEMQADIGGSLLQLPGAFILSGNPSILCQGDKLSLFCLQIPMINIQFVENNLIIPGNFRRTQALRL